MTQQPLSSLCRGNGKNGKAYKNHKINFLTKIPYTLNEIHFKKKVTDDTAKISNSKFRMLPGTYLTEKGQMLLYTQAEKAKGINQETATVCKTISYLYDTVQNISPVIKKDDTNCIREINSIENINKAFISIKNNWYFPKKWKSPAKVLIPIEATNSGYDFKNFTKSKREMQSLNLNSSNDLNIHTYKKYFNIYCDGGILQTLTNGNKNDMYKQKQNNAIESINSRSSSKNRDSIDTTISTTESLDDIIQNINKEKYSSFVRNISQGYESGDSCYEADDELIIRTNKYKNVKEFGDDQKFKCEDHFKMTISDVLGCDISMKEIKVADPNYIISKSISLRNQKQEELRLNLLKDLYGKLEFLSVIKLQLRTFGENLLNQFQEYNAKNKKARLQIGKDALQDSLKEMKERNDEIHLRLHKLSEKKLQANKTNMEIVCFRKKRDEMLLELSYKAKMDNDVLQSKMQKLVYQEDLKLKEIEEKQLKLEHDSIKYAFIKLKEELIKLQEKKTEIEHFIIRIEMRRENINKIEREILTSTPDILMVDTSNIPTLLKNIKEEIVLLWKSKMNDPTNNFKLDENKINNLKNLDDNLFSLPKEKGDLPSNMENSKVLQKAFEKNEIHENQTSKIIAEESEFFFKHNQKNYMSKLDYEMMKHGQKISTNFTYSYFVPWHKENYKGNFKAHQSADDECNDEKTEKTTKLDYKRILVNNPLLKKQKKNSKTVFK